MYGTERDNQTVHSGLSDILRRLFRLCKKVLQCLPLRQRPSLPFHIAGHFTIFSFHGNPLLMTDLHHLFCPLHIFFKRKTGKISHNRGKTQTQRFINICLCRPMIQMKGTGYGCPLGCRFHQRSHHLNRSIGFMELRMA